MLPVKTVLERLRAGRYDEIFDSEMRCSDVITAAKRAAALIERFKAAFDAEDATPVTLISAPCRAELIGVQTDRQGGCVLAAALNADILACAAPNGTSEIHITSESFGEIDVNLDLLSPMQDEKGTAAGLLRGAAVAVSEAASPPEGFDAYIFSDVPVGIGLASSSAFGLLAAAIMNELFCGGAMSPVQLASAGRFAESVYFGKHSGLMDQTAIINGGVCSIDYSDASLQSAERIDFDVKAHGYALCMIDAGMRGAEIPGGPAEIAEELRSVAGALDRETLRAVTRGQLLDRAAEIREKCGDREFLRAMHFASETERATNAAKYLACGDMDGFLAMTRQSGSSAAIYLQGLSAHSEVREQPVLVALAAANALLGESGAVRASGGGFGDSVCAFVPENMLEGFIPAMERIFGDGCCHTLDVRRAGLRVLTE